MTDPARYFDNAATTRPHPAVLREMLPFFDSLWGNASSIHSAGRAASQAVELARQRVAELIGADDPSEIVFTSGATESNNWVLNRFRGFVSPFEHSSIREPAQLLGFEVLQNDAWAVHPPNQAEFASIMTVNNETGAKIDIGSVRSNVRTLHSDITQAVGKVDFDLTQMDLASFSSHKIWGPKGVGALYAKEGDFPAPWLVGGGQESGFRAGTLNVPAIVGFGAAAVIASDRAEARTSHARELRETLLARLEKASDWRVNGNEEGSPFILSLSFLGIEGETLVIELDARGFAISSGAACSSGSNEPSAVLSALGYDSSWTRGTIRISFGDDNNSETTTQLAHNLIVAVENLRKSGE